MVGRNRRIAACAFALAMSLGCGQASALDLNAPASQLTASTGLPALPTLPDVLPAPAPVMPAAPAPAAAPGPSATPASSPSAVASSSTPAGPAGVTRPVFRETRGTEGPAKTGVAHAAGFGPRARKADRSRRSGAHRTGNPLPVYEPSAFDRLGRAIDISSPSHFFGEFTGGGTSSGMSWAVPLLALMLPIGLCGILLTVRQRQATGPGFDGRSSGGE
jgi:hypothetical protein